MRELALGVRQRLDSCLRVALVAFEACEPRVDATPAGADEVDEKREVVDARVALGEEIALDPLESVGSPD